MLFSCKITRTILTHLENQGMDLESVYESSEVPREFLLDSSYWLEADEMEKLLNLIDIYHSQISSEDFIVQSGHQVSELKTWGALDSVLRMVSDPQDALTQPQRFLSYFIDPAPPVAKVQKTAEGMSFEIPIEREQYPLCHRFIISAIEALPSFSGKELFKSHWSDNKIEISWSSHQVSMLSQEDQKARSIRPELFQRVLKDLEENQKKLEQFQKELLLKDKKIENLQAELRQQKKKTHRDSGPSQKTTLFRETQDLATEFLFSLQDGLSEIYRMNDYISRSFQLVTLLVGQGRADRQVKEAMRRVDWERIKVEYPQAFKKATDRVLFLKTKLEESQKPPTQESSSSFESSLLTEIVDEAIEAVSNKSHSRVKIDKHFIFDHQLPVDQGPFKQALVYILSSALRDASAQKGALRVVTRPRGKRAEIEISDTGRGYGPSELEAIFKDSKATHPFRKAQNLLKRYDSHLSITSEVGRGSTFTVDLPIS